MNTNLEDHYLDVSEMNKKELLGRQRSYSDYPEEKGELNVVVKRVKNITIPKNDAEIPAYKMSEIPRGLALIIGNVQFLKKHKKSKKLVKLHSARFFHFFEFFKFEKKKSLKTSRFISQNF